MPGKRSYLALWVALGFFAVFTALGAAIGILDVFARQQGPSNPLVDFTLSLMRKGLGIKGVEVSHYVLAGALGYGFIGFDLWLIIWLIYRFFKWGFRWKPGDPPPFSLKRDQGP